MESTFSCCAYCWKNEDSWNKILCYTCDGCQKRVHYDCIHSVQPSSLLGDTFFNFKCEACGEAGKEEFSRSNMSWHNVVMLALYNLHKTGQGIYGYFHWKSHIGAFIDQHWNTLFGYHRKKTTVWMGTIAGTLSVGCPEYFLSGTQIGQQGHWRLATIEPPTPNSERKKQTQRKKKHETPIELNPEKRKCRRSGESALAAAVELKEKWSSLVDTKELKQKGQRSLNHEQKSFRREDSIKANASRKANAGKANRGKSGDIKLLLKDESSQRLSTVDVLEEPYLSDGQISIASSLSTNSSFSSSLKSSMKDDDVVAQWDRVECLESILSVIKKEDEDFVMDMAGTMFENLVDPRPPSPDVNTMLSSDIGYSNFEISGKSPVAKHKFSSANVKQELQQSDTESEWPSEKSLKDESTTDSDEEEDSAEEEGEQKRTAVNVKQEEGDASILQKVKSRKKKAGYHQKRKKIDDTLPPTSPLQLKRISVFEEGELLQKLNDAALKQTLKPELAQLRRKLICNQTNREFGLPVFDLENQMDRLAKVDSSSSVPNSQSLPFFPKLPTSSAEAKETRDLDRFMIHDSHKKKVDSQSYTSFYQRLVGFKDHELTPVVSPYTTRILLPFIWRNYDISHKPLKLKLLQEIEAYPHRNDPSWIQPSCPPIDYCYLRPEHVPSVNALCREFFWPGIDVSECLQYPDFSCVVLYRKIVIAFAFMVPDRGYNEAYISFIFTHPEWRGAGIGTFMLYHLIQTCMGKDVLLHVSVNNPAMLLYQKFGFKCQELILNFYYKYFPLNSKESLHAFLMRLSR